MEVIGNGKGHRRLKHTAIYTAENAAQRCRNQGRFQWALHLGVLMMALQIISGARNSAIIHAQRSRCHSRSCHNATKVKTTQMFSRRHCWPPRGT